MKTIKMRKESTMPWNDNAPHEKHLDHKAGGSVEKSVAKRVADDFACEEGESRSPVPIPGLIVAPAKHGQTGRAGGYTRESTPATHVDRPDRPATQGVWTEEDGKAFQMPGLIVQPREAAESTSPEASATTALKGLCATCSLSATCTFSKPETGVWRCEEYA